MGRGRRKSRKRDSGLRNLDSGNNKQATSPTEAAFRRLEDVAQPDSPGVSTRTSYLGVRHRTGYPGKVRSAPRSQPLVSAQCRLRVQATRLLVPTRSCSCADLSIPGRRKGFSRVGQRWAMEENLPMLLEATRSDRMFYQRAGFVKYGVWRWGKEGKMTWDLMRWTSPNSKSSL
jgi:hypothetical protein